MPNQPTRRFTEDQVRLTRTILDMAGAQQALYASAIARRACYPFTRDISRLIKKLVKMGYLEVRGEGDKKQRVFAFVNLEKRKELEYLIEHFENE